MSESFHESLYADVIKGCVTDFLDTDGINEAAYVCGQCGLIAARGNDGSTYTAEGECEKLLFDAADREYSDIAE